MQSSVWSYRRQSDTERRTVDPGSITLNSYTQTTALLHFCCWPDDQREILGKNKYENNEKEYSYQNKEDVVYCFECSMNLKGETNINL